jgi:hypothetical protein
MGNICLSIHEIEIEMKDKSDIEREREKRERKKTEEKTRKLYKILSMDGLLI